MILYYPPFRASTDDELLEQAVIGAKAYIEDLAEFSIEALCDGWKQVRRRHKLERWPTIQAIREACADAAGSRDATVHRLRLPEEAEKRWMARYERDPALVPDGIKKMLGLAS